jgi:hypothetical protein
MPETNRLLILGFLSGKSCRTSLYVHDRDMYPKLFGNRVEKPMLITGELKEAGEATNQASKSHERRMK